MNELPFYLPIIELDRVSAAAEGAAGFELF